jgi:arsenate reductase
VLHPGRRRTHRPRREVLSAERSLGRRLTAGLTGSALLAAVVVGSGIFAQRLSPNDEGIQLLENSTATGVGLVALILTFGWVSGAHFNPVVTMAERLLGGIDNRGTAAYVTVQTIGCCIGAMVANTRFDLPAVNVSTHVRAGGDLWLGEIVATFGLLVVITGVVRSGRASAAPYAAVGYIAAAHWFTSSTSFANPANITIGRTLTDTFSGIAPRSAAASIAAQLIGGALAVAFAAYVFHESTGQQLVVEHQEHPDH